MSTLTDRLQQDLAEVAWRDLRCHVQRDAVILVASGLDLAATAAAVAGDDSRRIRAWIASGQMTKPTSAQLATWEQQMDKPFRMLIVQPFVLVQPLSCG
jgi:hypothetical protein